MTFEGELSTPWHEDSPNFKNPQVQVSYVPKPLADIPFESSLVHDRVWAYEIIPR